MVLTFMFLLVFILLNIGDAYYYVKAVEKYGHRNNTLPMSGYYEWFINKGRNT